MCESLNLDSVRDLPGTTCAERCAGAFWPGCAIHTFGALALLCVALLSCLPAVAANHRDWNQRQYAAYKGMPSERLLKRGEDFLMTYMKPDSALMCYTVVAERYRPDMTNEEKKVCLDGYYGRWQTFFFGYGNAPMALEDIYMASDIAAAIGEPAPKLEYFYGVCYMIIASSAGDHSLYSRAIPYFRASFWQALEQKDYPTLHRAFDNLATATFVVDSMQTMDREYRTLRVLREPDAWHHRQSLLIYDGFRQQKAGQLRQAYATFQDLIANVPRRAENMRYLTSFYIKRLRVEAALGSNDREMATLDTILGLSYRYNMPDVRQVALALMFSAYEKTGDRVRSDEYFRHYLALKDSLATDRFVAQFQELNFTSERRRMQNQMKEAQFQNRLRSWIIGLVAILFVATAIFLVFMKRRNRKLHERSEVLYRQLQELAAHEDRWLSRRALAEADIPDEPDEEAGNFPAGDAAAVGSSESDGALSQASSITSEALDELEAKIRQVILHSSAIFDPDFSLVQLTEIVGSNSRYVSQCINERFGCNFRTLVNKARIREAMRRFDDCRTYGDYSIEGVAESVGFRSRSSFSIWFKRFTGLAAAEYRKLGSCSSKPSL